MYLCIANKKNLKEFFGLFCYFSVLPWVKVSMSERKAPNFGTVNCAMGKIFKLQDHRFFTRIRYENRKNSSNCIRYSKLHKIYIQVGVKKSEIYEKQQQFFFYNTSNLRKSTHKSKYIPKAEENLSPVLSLPPTKISKNTHGNRIFS